jgi:death-on-curing protein
MRVSRSGTATRCASWPGDTMSSKVAVKRSPKRVREGADEPMWVTRSMIDAIHEAQLREHGGSSGVRDEGLLDSALHRPNKFAYGEHDLSVLAAAYAFGIAKNHAFVDGNKRTAFVTAALFVALNGQDLVADEPEVVDVMTRLASGKLTERECAAWVRAHLHAI